MVFNLAGTRFDFSAVLYAVLQDCEHRRRGITGDGAAARLIAFAAEKLDAMEKSYLEIGGAPAYWQALRDEVLNTAMPQYAPAAVRQTELEQSGYGVWRQGDPLARVAFALIGLTAGGIILAVPFIPIFEQAFAFALGLAGFLWPELRKLTCDYRHARLLNRLVSDAQRYQKTQLRYVSDDELDGALKSMLHEGSPEEPAPEPPHPHAVERS